jgi:hypothetical protein
VLDHSSVTSITMPSGMWMMWSSAPSSPID